MLKLILVTCVLIHCSNCFPFLSSWFGTSETQWSNMTEMIKQNQYPFQEHVVSTNDGYLLDLVRIRSNRTGDDNKQKKTFDEALIHSLSSIEDMYQSEKSVGNVVENDDDFGIVKPVVLLMPSLLTTAESFLVGGRTQGLAYKLADEGFDVFIGNVRGSTYGSKHNILNSEQDPLFWKFGIYEIATEDLPSLINEVLRISKAKSLKYIGHMEGSTLMYILLSEQPEYNQKVSSMVSLGPVAFMKNAENGIFKNVAQHLSHKGWLIKNLGIDKFKPSQELTQVSENNCTEANVDSTELCQDTFFLINGYNSRNINKTMMSVLLNSTHKGWTSTKVIKNYAQFVSTGRFGKCLTSEDTCNIMRDYNLSEITIPVSLIYTSNDTQSSESDVRKLYMKLPVVSDIVNVRNYTNNLELLLGNNVTATVLPIILKNLRNDIIQEEMKY